jgi:photosystem II stability/assembly factor-like uncharacterized protein
MRRLVLIAVAAASLATAWHSRPAAARVQSPTFDPALFAAFRWRHIGPFRGGRTTAAAGIPDRPNVFYAGAANGGVWTTNDYGRTWRPIFDEQATGSIGAIAIAPSDPNVIYVGSGEGLQRPDLSVGNGIYKSTDAGRSWRHLGLGDGQQIPQIVVDPANPDRLFVAVLGHPYGPNDERGIFRSTDGGATFDRVLHRDENTGGVDVAFDPAAPRTVYAALWAARQAPWEDGSFSGPGSGVFKSTDGGDTWRAIVIGLPSFEGDGLGRISITVAPSRPARLFATVDARAGRGLYRSDDAGGTWRLVNDDPRLASRGAVTAITVDPTNPDVVYTGSVAAWKSTDGGRTFAALRDAPGGGDYHRIWINPRNPSVILMAGLQGAVVTVNGGDTWSSRYNQPTAQFHHVITDTAFPYRVCGGLQDGGSACVASRGDAGRITIRDWTPVGVDGHGYVAPDPADPDVVFGGRSVTRFDRRTGQAQEVGPPRGPGFRARRTAPVLFSPIDRDTLFFAANTVWKTADGGRRWTEISPDLARETWPVPPTVGVYRGEAGARPERRGVISAVAPSYVDRTLIWAGTDDGLIHVTRDAGRTWTDVTPPQVAPWARVSRMAASHFDRNTAYAAIDTLRLDDVRPHIYRTRDGGRSWARITSGLPDGATANVVREDPFRRGLLFAGTGLAVYVSFDDGDMWQPLRLNMPATSIRDLAIKDNDLVAATHGRGFWILDDITPLRQITADITRAPAFLFRPGVAWRVRSHTNAGTRWPPGEPAAANPPDGVVISYLLAAESASHVTLEIVEPVTGEVIRRYASDDPDPPPQAPGLHRFVWDVRYGPPDVGVSGNAIAAEPFDTPRVIPGLFVTPGTYQVRLTVNGQTYRQPVTVRMDPRVTTSAADLDVQFRLSKSLHEAMGQLAEARRGVASRLAGAPDEARQPLEARQAAIDAAYAPLPRLFGSVQAADARPTLAVEEAVAAALERAREVLLR